MDLTTYLSEQRARINSEFDALKNANAGAKQQIASLEDSIKTRNEKMAQLQGAFAQLRHMEAAMNDAAEPVASDAAEAKPVRTRRVKSEQANG